MILSDLTDVLRGHYESEGWHAIYKKYGGAVLARENYRWKRKVMKRFGPNRKMAMRHAIFDPVPFLAKVGSSNFGTTVTIPLRYD